MSFAIRTTKPADDNKYYICKQEGGYNIGIHGYPMDKHLTALSNCVGFVGGRVAEATGNHKCDLLKLVNAENFMQYNTHLPHGMEPRAGAVMVWKGGPTYSGSDGAGHVAFVEKVNSPDEVMTSESDWGGPAYRSNIRRKGNGNWGAGNGYQFEGFLYIDYPDAPIYEYRPGDYKITCGALNVRTGPGTQHSRVPHQKMTANAKAQGGYKRGTVFTAGEVKNLPGESWAKTPSGWVCLKNQDGSYCEKLADKPKLPIYDYMIGNYRIICDGLNVRTGPGKKYSKVPYNKLTSNAKKQGGYKRGTVFTAGEVKNLPGESWAKTPSGWCCLKNAEGTYCERA